MLRIPVALPDISGNEEKYGVDVIVEAEVVLAYGFSRGWDEGYLIPNLGIAVHPEVRGIGLSKAFMYFLHVAARRTGARQVRLKAYPNDLTAIKLYKSLGYIFQGNENGQMVGKLVLK